MVSSFSARLISLNNKFNQKRKHIDIDNSNPSQAIKSDAMKSQSGCYYAHTHPHQDVSSNKRRRQYKELQYTAATIQTALADAGRPPMPILTRERRERALPMLAGSSVDMDRARVMTSKEFDALDTAANGDEEQEAGQNDEAQDISNSSNNDECDISSMNMYAGLIQSTRHYYSFSSDDTTSTPSTSNLPSKKETGAQHNDTKLNEDNNSEVLSTWSPSSSSNNLNDTDQKNIDNDNRSDSQSSGAGAGESSSSSSSSSSSDSISSADDSYTLKESKRRESLESLENLEGQVSIIGMDGPIFIIG